MQSPPHERAAALRRSRANLWLELLSAFPDAVVVMAAVLPRGQVEVVRANPSATPLLRASDGPTLPITEWTWRSLAAERSIDWSADAELAGSDSLTDRAMNAQLQALSIAQAIVAPVKSFLPMGYPAAVHVYRLDKHPPLRESNIAQLTAILAKFESQAQAEGEGLFVLDNALSPIVGKDTWNQLDPAVQAVLIEPARALLNRVSDQQPTAGDRMLRSHSPQQQFQVLYSAFIRHAAADNSPAAMIVVQPTVDGWMAIEADDFLSDAEIARYLPALKYIQEHAKESPSLANIARSVHLSPFHFHRKFAELFGMTPKQFLLECQIEEAQRFLLEGTRELADVAKQCGFAHQSHFTSRFKQATGYTPTRWRKIMQTA